MSTILQALQKQQANQNTQVHDNMLLESDNLKWKAALLTALLVIICLLGILIYMQFNPVNRESTEQAVIAPQKTEKVRIAEPVSGAENAQKVSIDKSDSRNDKPVVQKLTFVTKPLPEVKELEPAQLILSAQKEQIPVVRENNSNAAHKSAPPEPVPEKTSQELDYSGVSDDLQKRFKQAVLESRDASNSPEIEEEQAGDGSDIHQMGYAFQEKVPAMSYDFHVYSTIAEDRWIRINGEDLREGQSDADGTIKLIEIQPQRSIFRIGRQSFSLESLTDWKGY
ncbi:general secretion pathway protein GspB [Psychromonas aquimarina]|uniref:general secretion pathway protein GspB n=1 Tax=Psychromonas aquimarina TaxID=444919 RepID=UPI0004272C2F|nr:general secretion pathway protein GspB [Psychromonas aquimarina]